MPYQPTSLLVYDLVRHLLTFFHYLVYISLLFIIVSIFSSLVIDINAVYQPTIISVTSIGLISTFLSNYLPAQHTYIRTQILMSCKYACFYASLFSHLVYLAYILIVVCLTIASIHFLIVYYDAHSRIIVATGVSQCSVNSFKVSVEIHVCVSMNIFICPLVMISTSLTLVIWLLRA